MARCSGREHPSGFTFAPSTNGRTRRVPNRYCGSRTSISPSPPSTASTIDDTRSRSSGCARNAATSASSLALEVYGSAVLLRSTIVATDARGEGVGRAITEWLLAHAGALGARRAFLFTTNACAYFEGIGFEVVDRSNAPQSILATRQAAGLCPASAVLLTRTVTP